MRIVFWHEILSPHQSALSRALVEDGHQVRMVIEEPLTRDRLAMGWSLPDMSGVEVIRHPTPSELVDLIRELGYEAVHVFGGARWRRLGWKATFACLSNGYRLGIMSESADNRGCRGLLRKIKYIAEYVALGRRYDFVLAMGRIGMAWFRKCGYPPRVLFPFAYFTEPIKIPTAEPEMARRSPEILFLGQCIHRKGVDLLVRALSELRNQEWKLTVVGDGPERDTVRRIVHDNGLSERVSFLPFQDHDRAIDRVQRADLLVLPSRFDGWGAVVNEALMCGVPVVCSSNCGAADLLGEGWRGSVFGTGSVSGLRAALKQWLDPNETADSSRHRIRDWARCIDGREGAKYFMRILSHVYEGHVRPEAPWEADASSYF